jgi:NTE family protein
VAHTGVIQILMKEGIHPSVVAGCSSGAIAGAFYCAGVPIDRQLEFAQKLRWRSVRMLGIPKMGFFQPGEMERYLREALGDVRFEDLNVPLAVMATEFRTARSLVMREGPVAWALSASAAIPVVFSPVIDGKRVLVDGGLTDNLPAQVCRVMGADIILAVNVLPGFSRERSYHNMFDVALGTFDMLALPSTERGSHAADLTVVPQVGHINPSDMTRVEETVARGALAMRRALPELKKLLYPNDGEAKPS